MTPTTPHADRSLRRVSRCGLLAALAITLAFAGLGARLVQLQIQPPSQIDELAGTQQSRYPLHARRGNLLDRSGRVIATTRPATRLYADPALIDDPLFAERLAYPLGLDPAAVARKIAARRDSRYVVIDHELTSEQAAMARTLKLPGMGLQTHLLRDYPQGTLAGQVIGFVGFEGKGLEGLERILDQDLAGTPGQLRYLRDAQHRALWTQSDAYRPPTTGQARRLTLDLVIQQIAERALAERCEAFGAKAGQVVVMDPQTGQVLAMAHYPAFNPTDLGNSEAEHRRLRSITDVFEPGSTFKPFVWAAATEAGYADPTETIDTGNTGVARTSQGRRLRDAHPLGELSWEQVLVKSSNIGMAVVGERMGAEKLFSTVRRFGFGQKTGIELPGEVVGIVNPLKRWNHYSVTSVPMGQEIAVTALQLVRAYCVIANGGWLVQPTISFDPDRISDQDVGIYELVMRPQVAEQTRRVLHRVVTEGTGHRVNSELYPVFGKTGTAQIPDLADGGYLEDQYVASFVGGAPVDQPRIVVGCFIHSPDPKEGYYGGTVAGPLAKQVIEQTLAYLGVTPLKALPEPALRPDLIAASD